MKRKVMVFGIFDNVHEGHRFLFEQAKKLGEELIAVVGRDSYVREFKRKEPKNPQGKRLEQVSSEPLVDRAVLSDEIPSTYGVIEKIRPDVICLGYDQDELEQDLRSWMRKTEVSISIFRSEKLPL